MARIQLNDKNIFKLTVCDTGLNNLYTIKVFIDHWSEIEVVNQSFYPDISL